MAKAKGRNCVVQLGTGLAEDSASEAPKERGWFSASVRPTELLRQDLVTMMPMKITIEKLRGFVADHQARVVAVEGNTADLEIGDRQLSLLRRLTDRPVTFCLHLRFEEERLETEKTEETKDLGRKLRTRIEVTITTRRNRDRRRSDVVDRGRQVLASFRSYLMANEQEADDQTKGTFNPHQAVSRAVADEAVAFLPGQPPLSRIRHTAHVSEILALTHLPRYL